VRRSPVRHGQTRLRTCHRNLVGRIARRRPRLHFEALEPSIVGWAPGGSDVNDTTRSEVHDEESEDRAEKQVVGLQKVAGPSFIGVVAQKRRPTLTAAWARVTLAHVLLDGTLADANAELEKLAPDAFGARA
jgi:hypothetical protein